MDLQQELQRHFGFSEFRPGQLSVIESLIEGHSAGAVFPTGSGKSLCYQLPSLVLDGLTLVVSPLIALMKDQIDALQQRGIAAKRLDSTLNADEYRQVMNELRSGQLNMLYVAPERFNNERFRNAMKNAHVALLAIDEAHCISEWGHNFRPDYLKLADFAQQSGAERILALTATATPSVQADMCKFLGIDTERMVVTGCYRPNLSLLMTPVSDASRDDELIERLQQRDPGPSIVYVTLQKTAVEVADRLVAAGLQAKPYHAGMADEQRSAVQDWFLETDVGVVVATIAFGMGIDKRNIRYVYHYNIPKSLENYSQEIGRAGRDDEFSTCEMLVCVDDVTTLQNFAYGDTPTLKAVTELVESIAKEDATFDVSFGELSNATDVRPIVVRTLITYLELLKYVEGGTPFYQSYSFKPLQTSQQILEQFDERRRQFISGLFRQARKATTWFHVDVELAAAELQTSRERVIAALDYLGENEMLEVRVAGVRNRYQKLRSIEDPSSLAAKLHAKMVDRQDRDIARIEQVLAIAAEKRCQVDALCSYFGEPLEKPCGHCSSCLDGNSSELPARTQKSVRDGLEQLAGELQQENKLFNDPICLARFLCGIRTPSISRAKRASDPKSRMPSHPQFGSWVDIPFPIVVQEAERICS